LNIANGMYHVTNRGVERRAIVADDHDRRQWLRLLGRAATRYGWRVFAYVLMDNHFHVYLRTPQPNLSEGMHDFEGGHATLFNRRHERDGVLFQGRFHAVLVESDTHAWELSRYVHLNPVRGGLADDPANYVWSSYRYYLNSAGAPRWLDWATVLAEFAGTEAGARLAYRRFVLAGIAKPPASPFAAVVDDWLLGGPPFVDAMRKQFDATRTDTTPVTVESVVAAVSQSFEVPVAVVQRAGRHGNGAREAAIMLCRERVAITLEMLGTAFGGVTGSAVSEANRRACVRLDQDAAFRDRVERASRELTP
jgi:REP element-mobilizing transposase RayT